MVEKQIKKIVLIHGASGTKSKWRFVLPLLNGTEVIALDMPGHGENKDDMLDSIEGYADYFSDQLTEDCIVVGHSMGGMIALELANKSDFVKGIVMVASSYELPVHPKIIKSLGEGVFPESLFRASYGERVDPALLEDEKFELDEVPRDVAMKDFQVCDAYKAGEVSLMKLQKPVLAIIGDEDRLIPRNTQTILKKKNENVKVEVMQGTGHYNLLEQPRGVAARILQFKDNIFKK